MSHRKTHFTSYQILLEEAISKPSPAVGIEYHSLRKVIILCKIYCYYQNTQHTWMKGIDTESPDK